MHYGFCDKTTWSPTNVTSVMISELARVMCCCTTYLQMLTWSSQARDRPPLPGLTTGSAAVSTQRTRHINLPTRILVVSTYSYITHVRVLVHYSCLRTRTLLMFAYSYITHARVLVHHSCAHTLTSLMNAYWVGRMPFPFTFLAWAIGCRNVVTSPYCVFRIFCLCLDVHVIKVQVHSCIVLAYKSPDFVSVRCVCVQKVSVRQLFLNKCSWPLFFPWATVTNYDISHFG